MARSRLFLVMSFIMYRCFMVCDLTSCFYLLVFSVLKSLNKLSSLAVKLVYSEAVSEIGVALSSYFGFQFLQFSRLSIREHPHLVLETDADRTFLFE